MVCLLPPARAAAPAGGASTCRSVRHSAATPGWAALQVIFICVMVLWALYLVAYFNTTVWATKLRSLTSKRHWVVRGMWHTAMNTRETWARVGVPAVYRQPLKACIFVARQALPIMCLSDRRRRT